MAMRLPALAATLLIALTSTAWAQASGAPSADTYASDSAWVPKAYGLSAVAAPAVSAVTAVKSGSGAAQVVVVTQPPVQPSPTMQWYWDKEMWCITTYAGWTNAWDAIQYQYCVGDACPAKRRGCYAANAGGPTGGQLSVAADTIADNNNCLSENYCKGQ